MKKAIILGDGERPGKIGHPLNVLPLGGPPTSQSKPIEATKDSADDPANEAPHGSEDFNAFIIVKRCAISGNQGGEGERVSTPGLPNRVVGAIVNRRR